MLCDREKFVIGQSSLIITDMDRRADKWEMSQTVDAESEGGSICDEERVRKLFQACDGDGDGYIDR